MAEIPPPKLLCTPVVCLQASQAVVCRLPAWVRWALPVRICASAAARHPPAGARLSCQVALGANHLPFQRGPSAALQRTNCSGGAEHAAEDQSFGAGRSVGIKAVRAAQVTLHTSCPHPHHLPSPGPSVKTPPGPFCSSPAVLPQLPWPSLKLCFVAGSALNGAVSLACLEASKELFTKNKGAFLCPLPKGLFGAMPSDYCGSFFQPLAKRCPSPTSKLGEGFADKAGVLASAAACFSEG